MQEATTHFATEDGQKYLTQLCKHFAHKVPTTFDEKHGRIDFEAGRCELEADPDAGILVMRVSAADEAGLERLENVVAHHLVRFAFREQLEVSWKRAG